MDINHIITAWLWPAAIGTIPVAVVVGLVCRTGWCRASTRHALWLMVLGCFLVTPLVPRLRLPGVKAGAPTLEVDAAASERAGPGPEADVDVPMGPGVDGSGLAGWAAETERRVAELAREAGETKWSSGRVVEPKPVVEWSSGRVVESLSVPDGDDSEKAQATLPYGRVSYEPGRVPYAPPAPVLAYTGPLPVLARPTERAGDAAERLSTHSADTAEFWESATGWVDTAAWKRWTPKVQALRDAFATLPPVPTALWVGGGGLILAVIAGRTGRFRRVLTRSVAAPAGVRLMVQQAAREIGLKRVPTVLMTEQRVSPMVWCGLHSRLVLPSGLWEELDDLGRRAVILHELAHLRRRDHWVRWAELAASVVYWWHPVVWWVRGRLRDEADLCCDAWVTALLPRERRAYAMALVSTQSYLRVGSCTPPSVGMGVMTSSAERFARRLTMVMKARPNPRLSALGIIASLGLGIVASSSASLWACPPEDEKPVTKVSQPEKASKEKAAKAGKAPKAAREAERARAGAHAAQAAAAAEYAAAIAAHQDAVRAAQNEALVAAERAQKDAGAAAARVQGGALGTTRRAQEEAVARAQAGQPAGRHGGDSDARIRELESRLERLDSQIERLQEMLERSRNAPRSPLSAVTPSPRTTVAQPAAPGRPAMSAPRAAAGMLGTPRPSTLTTPRAAVRGGGAGGAVTIQPREGVRITAPRAPRAPEAPAAAQPGDDVRVYQISGGKLEALWALMSREDVPVFVSQQGGGIAVHGTEAQHRAFKAFIQIINPEGAASDEGAAAEAAEVYRIEVQNLDSMRHEDVAKVQEELHRHAEALAQRHAVTGQRVRALRSLNEQQRQEIVTKVHEAEKRAREVRGRQLNRADDAKALLERLHQDSQTIVQAQNAFAKQVRSELAALESRADGLEREAELLEEKASDLADRADELAEKAGELEGEARATAQQQVRELQRQSKEASKQARQASQEAEKVRKHMEAMEDDAEACQECAEEASEACQELLECDGAAPGSACQPCPEAAEASEPLAAAAPVAPEVPVVAGVPTPPAPPADPVLPPALPH